MKLNKMILCAALFFGCTVNVCSLSLEEVCKGLALHPNTTGNFIQAKTMKTAKGEKTLKSSGTFIISGEGIVWKTEKPFPSSMAITQTKIIQTAGDGSQSVIDGSDNQTFASIASTLAAVFSSDITELNKNFNSQFSDLGEGSWALVLEPKDATISSVLKKIDLNGTASGGEAALTSIKMTESSGNGITYTFSEQKYPQELTADEKANFKIK